MRYAVKRRWPDRWLTSAPRLVFCLIAVGSGCAHDSHTSTATSVQEAQGTGVVSACGVRNFRESEWTEVNDWNDIVALLHIVQECDESPYPEVAPGEIAMSIQLIPTRYDFFVEYSSKQYHEFSLTPDGGLVEIRSGPRDELEADLIIGWETYNCGDRTDEVAELLTRIVAAAGLEDG